MDTNTNDWNKGHPPFPGWWNASQHQDREEWRFHDGDLWSAVALADMTAEQAAQSAAIKVSYVDIEWTWDWPEGAEPRVVPQDVIKAELAKITDLMAPAKAAVGYIDPRMYRHYATDDPPTAAEIAAAEDQIAKVFAEDDEIDFS